MKTTKHFLFFLSLFIIYNTAHTTDVAPQLINALELLNIIKTTPKPYDPSQMQHEDLPRDSEDPEQDTDELPNWFEEPEGWEVNPKMKAKREQLEKQQKWITEQEQQRQQELMRNFYQKWGHATQKSTKLKVAFDNLSKKVQEFKNIIDQEPVDPSDALKYHQDRAAQANFVLEHLPKFIELTPTEHKQHEFIIQPLEQGIADLVHSMLDEFPETVVKISDHEFNTTELKRVLEHGGFAQSKEWQQPDIPRYDKPTKEDDDNNTYDWTIEDLQEEWEEVKSNFKKQPSPTTMGTLNSFAQRIFDTDITIEKIQDTNNYKASVNPNVKELVLDVLQTIKAYKPKININVNSTYLNFNTKDLILSINDGNHNFQLQS